MRSSIRITMGLYPLLAAAGLVGSWFVQAAHADIRDAAGCSGPPPGAHRQPPPPAFDACTDKVEGAACSVQIRDREITTPSRATSRRVDPAGCWHVS